MNRLHVMRPAFTLIELVVVMSMIALLIALLLPIFTTAREQARRTACLSNHRQNGTAFYSFATNRDGGAVLGYWDFKQFNYVVNVNADGQQGLGPWALFFLDGYITDPSFLICPSMEEPAYTNLQDAEQAASGQGDSNQWPIHYTPAAGKRVTRATYGVRPVVDVHAPTATPSTDLEALPTVRLDDYADRVIAADLVQWSRLVDTMHRDGVNTLRGDGAAAWVGRDAFAPSLSNLTAGSGFQTRYSKFILSDDESSGVFAELDEAR